MNSRRLIASLRAENDTLPQRCGGSGVAQHSEIGRRCPVLNQQLNQGAASPRDGFHLLRSGYWLWAMAAVGQLEPSRVHVQNVSFARDSGHSVHPKQRPKIDRIPSSLVQLVIWRMG